MLHVLGEKPLKKVYANTIELGIQSQHSMDYDAFFFSFALLWNYLAVLESVGHTCLDNTIPPPPCTKVLIFMCTFYRNQYVCIICSLYIYVYIYIWTYIYICELGPKCFIFSLFLNWTEDMLFIFQWLLTSFDEIEW